MKQGKKIAVVLGMTLFVSGIAGCGMFRDFDAKGYVQAVLDQTFQGEVEEAAKVMKNTSQQELKKQYEKQIDTFVENHLISGVQMDANMEHKYKTVCQGIFRSMKYQVKSEEKIDKKEYEVHVLIRPCDVFPNFVAAVKEDSAKLMDKANKGEYKGTEDEINVQMQTEFIADGYQLLEKAWKNMKYGEEETVILKVTGNKKNEFSVEEEEITNLITKIMRLDEIQD
ncbi:MAG: hypothetical protein RR869_04890 [Lachnospiraceae bacterium]